MEKHFLEILHEGDVMNEKSLEILKGGKNDGPTCPNLTSCGCYQGNAIICVINKEKPQPIDPKPADPKPMEPSTASKIFIEP